MTLRAVHLFGNWKWTGPADPVLAQVEALGDPSTLLLGACPFADLTHQVEERARQRGVRHRVLKHLSKHWNPLHTPRAAAELFPVLEELDPQVVHSHFDADQAALSRLGRGGVRPWAQVRSVHAIAPLPRRSRKLIRASSGLVICATPSRALELSRELGWQPYDVGVLETSVDLQRFHFTEEARRRGRQRLELDENDFALGVVARVQRHRRYELLIEAWSMLRDLPRAPRLVVLGRGTHEEEILHAPVRQAGLQERILCPGYLDGQDYLDALAACDAGVFLVPGTDASCRAVREWMAMQRGVLASRRPPLPDLIEGGVTGALVEESAAALARELRELDREEWRRRGLAAGRVARRRFSSERLAQDLRTLYSAARLATPGAAATWDEPAEAMLAAGPGQLAAVREVLGEPASITLLQPRFSRDVVLDTLDLLERTRARRLVLTAHPEWDRPFLEEVRRRGVECVLLTAGAAAGPRERWLEHAVDRVAEDRGPASFSRSPGA